jgi:uncharacterized protein (DUF111 family)
VVRVRAVGFAAGSRDIAGSANIVRALAGEAVALSDAGSQGTGEPGAGAAGPASDKPSAGGTGANKENNNNNVVLAIEQCILLESNIDHLSSEALAFACAELLAFGPQSGILDVWQEPIVMKKGRAAWRLCVLARPSATDAAAERIVALTGSLGLRKSLVERLVAERESITIDTEFGPVPYKVARALRVFEASEKTPWLRPEHDTVARIARERNVSYNELYERLAAAGRRAIVGNT